MEIRDYLAKKKIITDGGFGTYFSTLAKGNMLPEQANLNEPEMVCSIHEQYVRSGAVLIRTNTFAANMTALGCGREELAANIKAAFELARQAVTRAGRCLDSDCFIAGDIGPIVTGESSREEANEQEYLFICETLISAGARILVFETFPDTEEILPVIKAIKQEHPDLFVILQFCVNQYGYSNAGISARRLMEDTAKSMVVDGVGLNCGVGPGHLHSIYEKLPLPESLFLTALPNAGYPQMIKNRMIFRDNSEYFTDKMIEISRLGIHILGGCCGTTPEYIKRMKEKINLLEGRRKDSIILPREEAQTAVWDSSFFSDSGARKLLAVEISPPPGANDEKVMEAAFVLKNLKVDVVTFPDSPSGRTRADSVLMAKKVEEETGLCVMPHICCRDKNAIAMRSQLLGAYINKIRNLLVITGDPVPTLIRREVKSVFNFDAVVLMKMIQELNQDEFSSDPLVFGGAINQYRLNQEVEIRRIVKKMEHGASFFLTQPIFSEADAERVRRLKKQTGARILCGIMPLISLRNAQFIQNEMAGIQVTQDIIDRFSPEMSRQEGEAVGIGIAREVMKFTEDFSDGYYFSIPFNRVQLLHQILT